MRPCVMRLFVAPRYFFVALTLKLVGHPCFRYNKEMIKKVRWEEDTVGIRR